MLFDSKLLCQLAELGSRFVRDICDFGYNKSKIKDRYIIPSSASKIEDGKQIFRSSPAKIEDNMVNQIEIFF